MLGREIAAIPRIADVRERLINMASEPVGSTPQEFAAIMEAEVPRIEALLRSVGPQPR
jgi:tripartite-type tricarboxylate transporter receptor subunit TctC